MIQKFFDRISIEIDSIKWILSNFKNTTSTIYKYQKGNWYVFRDCPDQFVLDVADIYMNLGDQINQSELKGYYLL